MKTLLVVEHDQPLGPLPTEVGIWGSWVAAREANAADLAEALGLTAEDFAPVFQPHDKGSLEEALARGRGRKRLAEAARRVRETLLEVT